MHLVGHDNILEGFRQLIKADALHHAYLFYGQEHVGKRTLVSWITKTILCIKSQDQFCGDCSSCRQIERLTHPDVLYLEKEEGKKFISVKQVRHILDQLSQKSFYNGYKIAIIDQAQLLNEQASNALLKTIEEPYPKTILFFITSSFEQILETVRSRCHLIYVPLVSEEVLYDEVKTKTGNLDTAKRLSYMAFGRPGYVHSWLEDSQKIKEYLDEITIFLTILKTRHAHERFATLKELCDKDMTLNELRDALIPVIDKWFYVLHDILQIKIHQKQSRIVDFKKEIEQISQLYSLYEWQNMTKNLFLLRTQLLQNSNIRLALENYILSI